MARVVTKRDAVVTTNIVTTENGTPFLVAGAKTISIQAVIDVNTPSAGLSAAAAVNTTDNTITKAAHGFTTGLKGQFTTSGGLPDGLSTSTDYFIIVVDADTYKVASSLVNAQAGTAIDITTQGTGNHTFTPTSIAGGTITLQKSNNYQPDGQVTVQWDNVASGTSISADGNIWISAIDPDYLYARVVYTLTAGRLSAVTNIVVKEDR